MGARLRPGDLTRLGKKAQAQVGAQGALPGSIDTWRDLIRTIVGIRLKPEEQLTIDVMDMLARRLTATHVALHVANEAKRAKASWAVLRAMGFLKGVPDILIFGEARPCLPRVAWIELKVRSKPTAEQERFAVWCGAHGVPHRICTSVTEVAVFCESLHLFDNKRG